MAIRFKIYTERQIKLYAPIALWIFLSWMVISNLFLFYDYFTLMSYNALTNASDFKQAFTANLRVCVMAGLVGGIVIINLMERWLRMYVFPRALLQMVAVYTVTVLLISFLGALYYYREELGISFFSSEVIDQMGAFFKQWTFINFFYGSSL